MITESTRIEIGDIEELYRLLLKESGLLEVRDNSKRELEAFVFDIVSTRYYTPEDIEIFKESGRISTLSQYSGSTVLANLKSLGIPDTYPCDKWPVMCKNFKATKGISDVRTPYSFKISDPHLPKIEEGLETLMVPSEKKVFEDLLYAFCEKEFDVRNFLIDYCWRPGYWYGGNQREYKFLKNNMTFRTLKDVNPEWHDRVIKMYKKESEVVEKTLEEKLEDVRRVFKI